MSTKVSEMETTIQVGSTSTIDRTQLTYSGAKLARIDTFRNGTPNGSAVVTYGGDGPAKVEYTDKDNDRATETLEYQSGHLSKARIDVPGVYVDEQVVRYDNTPVRVNAIETTHTPAGLSGKTTFLKFEYDMQGQNTKQTFINGNETSTTELKYLETGELDRASSFSGATHLTTYTFRYREGKLDEVSDDKNNRTTVSYDQNGKIIETRQVNGTTTITTRYTYATGSVDGWSFAPNVPAGNYFDLAGNSFSTVDIEGGELAMGDIPKATTTGGTCSGVPNTNACDMCLASNCCAQEQACLQGSACYSFYQCYSGCNGATSCQTNCRSSNSAGAAAYDAFNNCGLSKCSSQCGQ